MKSLFASLAASLALLVSLSAQAQYIYIDLSYKVVRNPADGSFPPDFSVSAVNAAVDRMNALLESYGRGYRFRHNGGVAAIGNVGDMTGPSRWYSTDFFDDNNGDAWKDQMEAAAISDARYRWDPNAINIYITAGICGGKCSFPQEGDNIIIVGGCSTDNGEVQLHEIGHYFSLYHTQGWRCGRCSSCGSPVTDYIDDTLSDRACWTWDQVAANNFPSTYPNVTSAERILVENTYSNVMSYHATQIVLTEQQLDRWTDAANRFRQNQVSGRTLFVSRSGGCINPDGQINCTRIVFSDYGGPFPTVANAVSGANANGSDIILLRSGSYNERLTITKAVTLRASRSGSVTIGQ